MQDALDVNVYITHSMGEWTGGCFVYRPLSLVAWGCLMERISYEVCAVMQHLVAAGMDCPAMMLEIFPFHSASSQLKPKYVGFSSYSPESLPPLLMWENENPLNLNLKEMLNGKNQG